MYESRLTSQQAVVRVSETGCGSVGRNGQDAVRSLHPSTRFPRSGPPPPRLLLFARVFPPPCVSGHPLTVTQLATSLTDVDGDDFTHVC